MPTPPAISRSAGRAAALTLALALASACDPDTRCAPGLTRVGNFCVPAEGAPDAGESPDADATPADATSPEAGGPSCARDRDCPASAPVCSEGTCSACETSAACSARADTPVCSEGACVACTASEPGACAASGEVCVTGGTTCAACNTNAECPSPSASRCLENACSACEEDADCGHLETKVCAEGVCVECTPAKEQTACAGTRPTPDDADRACDPETKTCSGAPRGSVSECEACASDSECVAGYRCVPMRYQGVERGSYCLLEVTPTTVCPNQYVSQREATSLLGVTAEYCFPDQELTTCEATLAFKNLCSTTPACGTPELPGSTCLTRGAATRCTYACVTNADCPSSSTCQSLPSGNGKACDPF